MNRQALHSDPNADSYETNRMQQISNQRMQQNVGMNKYLGRNDSYPSEQGRSYLSYQWDREGPKGPDSLSSRAYGAATQGSSVARSHAQGHMQDSKFDMQSEAIKGCRLKSYEQDMEIGYEDKPSSMTFESLEKKFNDEIQKLIKEQIDQEDAEIARHRERIAEINNQYQEKLSALRTRQASRRDEILRKELETRQCQYQQAGVAHHIPRGAANDPQGYAPVSAHDKYQAYSSGHYESTYREQPPYLRGGRTLGNDARVPFPEGRAYNNNNQRLY